MIARYPTLVLAGCLALGATFAGRAVAQDDKEKREPDPEVAAKIEQLQTALKDRKGEQDADAVRLIRELVEGFPKMVVDDQKDVVTVVEKVFRARRKADQPALYREALTAFGTIGERSDPEDRTGRALRQGSADTLRKLASSKPLTEDGWEATLELAYENLGRTRDDRGSTIDFLVEAAIRSPYEHVMRAAGKALRHYSELEQKRRRDIFDKLLKRYMEIEGRTRASLDPSDADVATARRMLQAVQDAWNGTLTALSGANQRTAEDWNKWWNDHKNDPKAWK